jgi:hypothetical protein
MVSIFVSLIKWKCLVEDSRLIELTSIHGTLNWGIVSEGMIGRDARECRERWQTFLSPGNVNEHGLNQKMDCCINFINISDRSGLYSRRTCLVAVITTSRTDGDISFTMNRERLDLVNCCPQCLFHLLLLQNPTKIQWRNGTLNALILSRCLDSGLSGLICAIVTRCSLDQLKEIITSGMYGIFHPQ